MRTPRRVRQQEQLALLPTLSALVRHGLQAFKAIVAVTLLFLVGAMLAGAAPTLFGYESFVVLSGSMEPVLQVGDLAVVGPVRPDQLRVRDIISYRTPVQPNMVVTHRLVGIDTNEAGQMTFTTRGDANDSVDQVEVDPQAVLGRVAYAVPKMGYLVDFARQPLGKLVLLGLPALLLALDALGGWRRARATPQATDDLLPQHTDEPPPAPSLPAVKRISPADALIRQAWVAQRNGRLGDALSVLDQAIAADPTSEDAWLLKAECLQSPGARLTCLWEGLAAIPSSAALLDAADRAAALLRA
ncbi:MAG: signal peptidase I, partial [Chloroflexota bacterium]